MPMIDVYATTGTFANRSELARDLAAAMMRWEGVPEIPLFLDNTAAFVHDLDPDALANASKAIQLAEAQKNTQIATMAKSEKDRLTKLSAGAPPAQKPAPQATPTTTATPPR